MHLHDAIALIENAVGKSSGAWADFGAGEGTFTQALLPLLGPGSKIYTVDRDEHAMAELRDIAASSAGKVVALHIDFARVRELRALIDAPLDGIVLANALHFVRNGAEVLRDLVDMLIPGGRIVLIEYDRRDASQWVPYPIPLSALPDLAAAAGLDEFVVTATRPSAYRGVLYAAFAIKSQDDSRRGVQPAA